MTDTDDTALPPMMDVVRRSFADAELRHAGLTVGRPALTVDLMVVDATSPEARERLLRAADAAMLVLLPGLRWWALDRPDGEGAVVTGSKAHTGLADAATRMFGDAPGGFLACGDASGPREAGKSSLQLTLRAPGARIRAGGLSLSLPLESALQARPGKFLDLVLGLTDMLAPDSGRAGLGVCLPADEDVIKQAAASADTYADLLRDAPGLFMCPPAALVRTCGKGLASADWLTVIGDRWLESLSLDHLADGAPSESAPVSIRHRYQGGLVLQAGPSPSPGVQGKAPDAYALAAGLIKPATVAAHPNVCCFSPAIEASGEGYAEACQRWSARLG